MQTGKLQWLGGGDKLQNHNFFLLHQHSFSNSVNKLSLEEDPPGKMHDPWGCRSLDPLLSYFVLLPEKIFNGSFSMKSLSLHALVRESFQRKMIWTHQQSEFLKHNVCINCIYRDEIIHSETGTSPLSGSVELIVSWAGIRSNARALR